MVEGLKGDNPANGVNRQRRKDYPKPGRRVKRALLRLRHGGRSGSIPGLLHCKNLRIIRFYPANICTTSKIPLQKDAYLARIAVFEAEPTKANRLQGGGKWRN